MRTTRFIFGAALVLILVAAALALAGPAARVGDMHLCPLINPNGIPHVGGPIAAGCPTVLICGHPAARVTDPAVCNGPTDSIVQGSATVLIGGLPAARFGDASAHGGVVIQGCGSVLIGP